MKEKKPTKPAAVFFTGYNTIIFEDRPALEWDEEPKPKCKRCSDKGFYYPANSEYAKDCKHE